ncbi:MAG: acetyl-CoA carboxylase carboxyl transferase subunit beta [Flavobacteriales bacterium]|nr:acetyl-CoA carboxylase carboxyl transferase subunit beta [Flavobacteriales bacterium]|tara:strand:- start:1863 stop:2708 length:846 start_codon:yes stop_codon:yes gene_type:complete
MGWFKRIKKGVTTSTNQKKEIPEGLWYKCPKCKTIITSEQHHLQYYVCNNCNHHHRINAKEYFEILFDKNKFTELDENMSSKDPLEFEDRKTYTDRLKSMQTKTGLKDAVTTAYGQIDKKDVVIACFNFNFIGGSMGSVVGEKIARAIDYARETKTPIIIISKSGGARMMEASFSLMQLAKTSAKLAQLGEEGVPYFSILTDPTTGGITASFAMLGDLNIGEPNALIGFAGPRVVKETIGKDLPKGFQTAEFVQEHGFLDMIVDRKNMKEKLSQLIRIYDS